MFKTNKNANGEVQRYKARLVAKGYKQKAVEIRIDFDGSGAKAAGFEDEADAASGALRMRPMLLAVTPLPRPLTTPPVTNTYFISPQNEMREGGKVLSTHSDETKERERVLVLVIILFGST